MLIRIKSVIENGNNRTPKMENCPHFFCRTAIRTKLAKQGINKKILCPNRKDPVNPAKAKKTSAVEVILLFENPKLKLRLQPWKNS